MPRRSNAPRTRLDDWYDRSPGNTPEALSRITGISKSKLSKIKLRKTQPSRDEAFAIQRATNMFVEAEDCPGVGEVSDTAEPVEQS